MRALIENNSGCRIGIPDLRRKLGKLMRRLRVRSTVGVFFVPKYRMKSLNRKYRHKNKETDVLSFEMNEAGYLGDIIISPEVAKRNAKAYGASLQEEIARLVIHGLLHLLGHDHKIGRQEKRMFALQDKLFKEVCG